MDGKLTRAPTIWPSRGEAKEKAFGLSQQASFPQIRGRNGVEVLLKPPSFDGLHSAAVRKPVVIINHRGEWRSDDCLLVTLLVVVLVDVIFLMLITVASGTSIPTRLFLLPQHPKSPTV